MTEGSQYYKIMDWMVPENARQCKFKQEFFFRKAMTVAQNSPCLMHRHGAVIVKDNEIVSEGFNHKKWHLYHKASVHAEIDALTKMKHNKKLLSQCDMYVVRIGGDCMGRPLKYSKPCQDCMKAISKSGLRRVYYSTSHQYEEFLMYQTANGCSSPSASTSGSARSSLSA